MKIFKTLPAGDSASWLDSPWLDSAQSMRLTSADWALTYQLRGASQLMLTAIAEGDGWRTTLATTASATLLPGTYVWSAYLSKTDQRKTIGGGTLSITQDLAAVVTSLDGRTQARRALDECEAALASFKSSGGKVKSYAIGGRQTEYHSLQDLMMVRDFWQRKVNGEVSRASIKNGGPNLRFSRVRFSC